MSKSKSSTDSTPMDLDPSDDAAAVAAKAARKAARKSEKEKEKEKAAAAATGKEEESTTLRDGKTHGTDATDSTSILSKKSPRFPSSKSPKLGPVALSLSEVKKSPRLAAMSAPKGMVPQMEEKKKEEKSSKKRKASDDVQSPEEETMSLNIKKSKKDSKSKKKEEEDEEMKDVEATPADAPDANGNPHLSKFNISQSNLDVLKKHEITHAFPIQAATYDIILKGQDVVGRARTGTGKTLAFALPIVERLLTDLKGGTLPHGRAPKVIVLTPTRELALQIQKTFDMIRGNKLQTTCVYGGAPYGQQMDALRRGVDIVVGTCGRIKDLLEKGSLKLDKVGYVILDETDEMLSMGFADDVEIILSNVPRNGSAGASSSTAAASSSSSSSTTVAPVQTLLFSATIPTWVDSVARKYLRPDKKYIDLVGNTQQHANADVQHLAMACHYTERNSVLGEVIQMYGGPKSRVIIFTETKKEANELLVEPSIKGACAALHGDIPQAQRENTLKGFRDGKFPILIATDVAARGLDIAGVELVIQCEPPEKSEDYIHRSGRTGRAGKKGICITFYTPKQMYYIQNIETRARVKLQRVPVPQQSDMIKSSVTQALKAVNGVSADVIPFFLESAKALLSEMKEAGKSKEEVLAMALAKVAGFTEAPKKRSLLTSASGMITAQVQLSGGGDIRSLSFIWQLIRRYIAEDCDDKVKGIRMLQDRTGAVFDIPQEYEKTIAEVDPSDKRVKFSVVNKLPDLVQLDVVRPEPKWRGGGGRSSGGGGGRGGGGFSRGGRGGGSGRGGRR